MGLYPQRALHSLPLLAGQMALGRDTLVRVCGSHDAGSMCCGNDEGSYLRMIDSCISQLEAQGPSRTCNESKEEEGEVDDPCLGVDRVSTSDLHVAHILGR